MKRKAEITNERIAWAMDVLEKKTEEWWKCHECGDGCYEFSTYSPEGENVIITLCGLDFDDLAADADDASESFDPSDHAAQIYHAKHYGSADEQRFYAAAPDDLKDLIADAEAIRKMHIELGKALRRAGRTRVGK